MSRTDVTAQHPDYCAALKDWDLVSDAAAGESTVKAKKETYLPKPNANDKSAENTARYDAYVHRAVYYNATGRTRSSLVGIAFKKWPTYKLPEKLTEFEKDVTGGGVNLVQFSMATLGKVLDNGRAGIWVDFPKTDGKPLSVADQEKIKPTFSLYPAKAITNWRTRKVDGRTLLDMVVLEEQYEEHNDFATERKTQYRVLRLDALNEYYVDIYRKQKADEGGQQVEKWLPVQEMHAEPTRGDGKRWKEIPFQFIGSRNNDAVIDPAPLYDLAVLNLAHYRNSADYEDSVYLCGQPQPWMAGLDVEWRDAILGKGLYVGSRNVIPLPVGGGFGIEQASPNTLAKEAMDAKEKQMAALGARLIERGGVAATATEVDSDDATAHSVLSLCCDNVSIGITSALKWASDFAKAAGTPEFSIPTEFTSVFGDIATITGLLAIVQAGKMTDADFFAALRAGGWIDAKKTDKEIVEELVTQTPTVDLDEDEEPAGNTAAA